MPRELSNGILLEEHAHRRDELIEIKNEVASNTVAWFITSFGYRNYLLGYFRHSFLLDRKKVKSDRNNIPTYTYVWMIVNNIEALPSYLICVYEPNCCILHFFQLPIYWNWWESSFENEYCIGS